MQLTVKSTKIGRTGTNEKGDWELIVVTSDDGTDYTTFHKGAKNLLPGTVIEVGEVIIKNNKHSFKEYTVISAPTVPVVPVSNGHGMTPELWAEKDRLERWSRECNTCIMAIDQLTKCRPPDGKELELHDAAIAYALAHFQPTKEMPKVEKPQSDKAVNKPVTDPGEFKDLGDFLTKVTKVTKLKRDEICTMLSINDVTEITDYAKDWAILTGKKPEAAEGGKVTPENLPSL